MYQRKFEDLKLANKGKVKQTRGVMGNRNLKLFFVMAEIHLILHVGHSQGQSLLYSLKLGRNNSCNNF